MPIPWKKIIEIIILILELIAGGLGESQAIAKAASKSGLSVNAVRGIWKSFTK